MFPETVATTRPTEQATDLRFADAESSSIDTRASVVCRYELAESRWVCELKDQPGVVRVVERTPSANTRLFNPIGRSVDTALFATSSEDATTTPDTLKRLAAIRVPASLSKDRQLQEAVNAIAAGTPVVAGSSSVVQSLGSPPVVFTVEDDVPLTVGRLGFDQPFALEAAVAVAHRLGFWRYSDWAASDSYIGRVGFEPVSGPPVSALLVTRRPEMLRRALDQVLSQTYRDLELIVGLHGKGFQDADLGSLSSSTSTSITVRRYDSSAPLGEILDDLVAISSGRLVTKFDDDDWYSADHIRDLVAGWRLTGAEVVGKAANFAYLEGTDRTVAYDDEFQFREVAHIPGGTMMASRDLLADYRFGRATRAVDSLILRKIRADGGVLYSASRQGFMRRRHSGHTAEFAEDWYIKRAHGRFMYGKRLDLAGVTDERPIG